MGDGDWHRRGTVVTGCDGGGGEMGMHIDETYVSMRWTGPKSLLCERAGRAMTCDVVDQFSPV